MSNGAKALGEAIRARRNAKFFTQEALADGAGIKLDTLCGIEAGRTEYPRPRTIQKIARALGCEPEELAPCVPTSMNHDMLALTSPPGGGPPQDLAAFLAAQITRTDLMSAYMDRRTTMQALAGAALLNPVESWLWNFAKALPSHRPARFAPERHHDIENLEDIARSFRELCRRSGAVTYRTAVIALLNEVASIFEDDGLSRSAKERLYRVMADLADTAAEISWDCGRGRQAQEYYGLALRCAYMGGDFAFGANVLAGMARQMSYLGHHHDALDLIRLAQQRVDRTTDPRVLAHLDLREASAFAALARVPAFQRATMQAREHFAAATTASGPYWLVYFSAADISGVTGARLMELARREPREYAESAVAELSHAIQSARIKTSRGYVLDQIALAECYFLLGDTPTAVEQANHALSTLEYTQAKLPSVWLGELFQQVKRAPQIRSVVDVKGRIREALTSREGL
jgi:transcriptional regulator with XRE-family HTH domain